MATEKYVHPVSAAAKRPPGPFAWRFWPVSPRNVPNALYRDIVKFNLNHQIAAIGYMDEPMYDAEPDREHFAEEKNWSRKSRDIAYQFARQMKRGDILFMCKSMERVLAWGLLLDDLPLYFAADDSIWNELGPLRDRVWALNQYEQYCNYRRVDRWRQVNRGPAIESGKLPGMAQPTVASYRESEIVKWLNIGEDLIKARQALPANVDNPRLFTLAPRIDDPRVSAAGQGRQHDIGRRNAVEWRAMDLACAYYRERGYAVRIRAETCPYDLECRKNKETRLVEVKGSTQSATTATLTINEVRNARDSDKATDLFVVSSIMVTGHGSAARAIGGRCRIFRSWEPEDDDLEPTQFRYTLPTGGKLVQVMDSVGEEE